MLFEKTRDILVYQLKAQLSGWLRLLGSSAVTWGTVLVISTLGVFVLLPLGSLVWSSVTLNTPTGIHLTASHFGSILMRRQILRTAKDSLLFASGSAVVALFFGWTCAWIIERTNTPFKALGHVTAIISLATPYVLSVSAWLLLLGRVGPFNQLYRELSGRHDALINIYSIFGMVVIEGFLWSPLAFFTVGGTLRSANSEFEEAARTSGAGVGETIRRVTWRLSLPSVLTFLLLVFIRSLEAFDVPDLVGLPGHIHVVMTDIYGNMLATVPPDLGGASAFSVLLIPLLSGLLYAYGRLTRHCGKFATITGKGFHSRILDLGALRFLTAGFLLLNFILLVLLPVGMLAWVSLLPFYQPLGVSAVKLLTLNNYRAVFSSENLRLVTNTLLVAMITATFTLAFTLVGSWLASRRMPGAIMIERLSTIPLVFPGLVLGVAVMQLFLHVPIPIYGTIWVLIWAFVVTSLPYGMRFSSSGMLQVHRELEEAASICGASSFETLRRIILPLLTPSLLTLWLFIFLMCIRMLSLAVVLTGPNSQTMAVAIFDLWSNGQMPELAALGLLWTTFMAVVAVAFHIFTRRSFAAILNRVSC